MNANFIKGLLIGLVVPVVAFYFYTTLVLESDFETGIKQLLHDNLMSQVISLNVLANIVPMFVFNNRGENQALKGVVGASLLYAVAVSVLYFL